MSVKLLRARVRPYYLYQCDLIQGSSHLRTSVSKGLEIIDSLRGHTSGYAVPQYVIDGPGGGGKIPINPNYVVARTPDSIVLRNYKGDIYEYPEVASADKTAPEPTPIYRHLEFLDPIEEREEITSRSWRAGRRDYAKSQDADGNTVKLQFKQHLASLCQQKTRLPCLHSALEGMYARCEAALDEASH